MRAWVRANETAAVGLLMIAPALAAVGGLIVYPLVRGFQTSIESSGQYGQPQRYVGLRNYRQVLDDPTAVAPASRNASAVPCAKSASTNVVV